MNSQRPQSSRGGRWNRHQPSSSAAASAAVSESVEQSAAIVVSPVEVSNSQELGHEHHAARPFQRRPQHDYSHHKNQHRNQNPQQPQAVLPKRSHAALVLIMDKSLALNIIELFNAHQLKNSENEALVCIDLPLPDTDGQLMHQLVKLVPETAVQTSLDSALTDPFPYVCGIGVNPNLFLWMRNNRAHLRALAESEPHRQLVMLSTVEKSSLRHGYPNVDVVGAICHGTIDNKEHPLETIRREVLEEACLVLPDDYVNWEPVSKEISQQTLHDQRIKYQVRQGQVNNLGVAESELHIFCRVVPSHVSNLSVDSSRVTMHKRQKLGAIVIPAASASSS